MVGEASMRADVVEALQGLEELRQCAGIVDDELGATLGVATQVAESARARSYY